MLLSEITGKKANLKRINSVGRQIQYSYPSKFQKYFSTEKLMSLIGATSILTEEHIEGNFSLACCSFNFFFHFQTTSL